MCPRLRADSVRSQSSSMLMSRVKSPSRRWAALLMLIALLYAQWAVASYACTMPTSGWGAVSATESMPGMDCPAEPNDRSLLCILHCDGTQASSPPDPVPSDLAIGVPVIVPWAVAALPMAAMPAERGTSDVPRQTSPPPLLLTRRFRN